jgi:hypothetical protein
MNNVLVICHGHQHRHIHEINYATAKLLNIDDESEPDYVMDIADPRTPQLIGRTFDVVINAFCPISIEFDSYEAAIHDRHDNTIDGELNPRFFGNIWKLLTPGGHFYTRPSFDLSGTPDPRAISLFTDKLFRFGYVLDHANATLTFGEDVMSDFIVYRKVALPSRQGLWGFLSKRLVQSPPIKAITLQTYNSEMDLIETNWIQLNETDYTWLEGEDYPPSDDIDINLETIQDLILQPQVQVDANNYQELRSLVLIRSDDRTIRVI